MDNSFLEIINEFKSITKQEADTTYTIGKVVSAFPNIIINAYGVEFDRSDLYVNPDLIKDDVIQKSDKVLLLPFEDKYIILCKVVDLDG